MKQKKYEEFLRKNLPESEERDCPECKQNFYDEFNFLGVGAGRRL